MRNKLKALICLIIPILLAFVLNTKFGNLPPVLKFLNPFTGFWQNAESLQFSKTKKIKLKGTRETVDILFDDRMIPHIFAKNDHDVYFAQGYVTAMNRLFQMDFQTRYAAGRISEVIGAKAIELDQYQRRMGMVYGAENSLKGMMADPKSREMVNAYTEGINSYIRSLTQSQLPIEYKLLDFQPEEWTPLKCALLLKQMSATLAMNSTEFYMTNILKKFGIQTTADLFPDYPYKEDPIIPTGTPWNFKASTIPSGSNLLSGVEKGNVRTKIMEEGIGSNNWALSGSKTASGNPILANDPHLDLTLPSIWYQVQLHAPGLNAFGVSLPGAPGIIIGFNEQIAWGVTNVDADVLDYYQIKFKDNSHQQYWYNNQWENTRKRLEVIKVRGGSKKTDTVIYTHHGPVVYFKKPTSPVKRSSNVPKGSALRWIAHDSSNEILTFYHLNRGKNYQDYRNALKYYSAPAQNFVFASSDNDIAITVYGKFPLKYKNQGKFILDGSKPSEDWQGWIPNEENPTAKNPKRNFLSSANQSPTDKSYPYYINWQFGSYERGKRINDRLNVMEKATIDSMRVLQTDSYSVFAENILPALLSKIESTKLNATQKEGIRIIHGWDKFYSAKSVGASLFEIWTKQLFYAIWDDEFTNKNEPMMYPSRDRTVQLILKDPNSKWFDNIHTPQVETLNELVNESFKFACDSLEKRFGPIGESWEWANLKQTHIPHLLGVNGFGSQELMIGGGKNTINAMSTKNGPSWRMVVEMNKRPTGFGVYPGGQSGNPGSPFYDNMLATWAEGKLYKLTLMSSVADTSGTIISHLKLSKK